MNGWRSCIYPVPDDGFETLERIMISLPDIAYMEVSWEMLPAFVVTVADPKAKNQPRKQPKPIPKLQTRPT